MAKKSDDYDKKLDKYSEKNRTTFAKASRRVRDYNEDRFSKGKEEIKNDGSYNAAIDATARHMRRHPKQYEESTIFIENPELI